MSDVRIPDPIDAAVRRAAAALPAQAWDFDALRSRRLHRPGRWRWLAGLAAGAVAVVVAGSAVLSPSGTGPVDPPVVDDTETPPDASLVPWIFAVDPDHLYANRADCRDCTERLVRSDDGGVTWARVTDQTDRSFRLMVGPDGALLVEGIHAAGDQDVAISNDGGQTWKSIVDDPEPFPSLPAGAILSCGSSSACPLGAIDPQTGRRSALPGQPPTSPGRRTYPVRGSLWVDGEGRTTLSISASHDGGLTWSTETAPCPSGDCNYSLVPGLDESTVYRVRLDNTAGEVAILRSTDAGRTWQSYTVAGAPAAGRQGGQAAGIVAADGSLIVLRFPGSRSAPEAWVLGPADGAPRRVELTGLPRSMGWSPASALTGNPDAGYLLRGPGYTVYRSLDGLTWSPMVVPAPN